MEKYLLKEDTKSLTTVCILIQLHFTEVSDQVVESHEQR